ncbi:amino acid permease [Glutamicibacter sp. AOP12-B1-11]|uniref:amino acid permease n=1 Tax=Glutamicibacter sp. AOP12-B1-11 TaxID=3457725 RepID=UPI00403403EC
MSSSLERIKNREAGLSRQLSAKQLSMIALGGAIGTGLFLGSKFAISFAGPSVIISYAIGGFIAVLLMGALAEMTVAHSTTGSFGAFAEHYINPFTGFMLKYLYWSCIVLAVGTEITAVGDYMQMWFPEVPPIIWVVGLSVLLIGVNMFNVKAFGTLEYWFSAVKVFAIVAFILLAAILVFGKTDPSYGLGNYTAGEGFFMGGIQGVWFAVVLSIFSYLSIEMIAVAAGEAKEPESAVKKAFKVTLLRLFLFYLLTLSLILAIAPVDEILQGDSPFVTVMQVIGIPFADSLLNFVVIVAALSAMNSQLYISTRMMFSLARARQAPVALGRLRKNGAPVNALLLSAAGIAVATIIYATNPEKGFTLMMALSMFGAMATWLLIFLTHLFFRRQHARTGEPLKYKLFFYPLGSVLGVLLMLALLVTTLFIEEFRLTLIFGIPFAAVVAGFYFLMRKRMRAAQESDASHEAAEDEPDSLTSVGVG